MVAENMGEVFPEIAARQKHVQEVIRTEEEAFNRTLDRGIELFRCDRVDDRLQVGPPSGNEHTEPARRQCHA